MLTKIWYKNVALKLISDCFCCFFTFHRTNFVHARMLLILTAYHWIIIIVTKRVASNSYWTVLTSTEIETLNPDSKWQMEYRKFVLLRSCLDFKVSKLEMTKEYQNGTVQCGLFGTACMARVIWYDDSSIPAGLAQGWLGAYSWTQYFTLLNFVLCK